MNDKWLRRLAWGIAIFTIVTLIISAIILFLASDPANQNWLWNQITAIVTVGAPILGLIIVTKQPRQHIGWLWLLWGVVVSFRTLGYAIYYFGGSQPAGYSPLVYFLLWSTELSNVATLIFPSLLMLLFPLGQLPSRRWRFLYIWLFLAGGMLTLNLFLAGTYWNGNTTNGIVINNPYGWLPADSLSFLAPSAFFSLVFIMILAAVSLISRYRSSGQMVRLQLRWFVLGGFCFVILTLVPVFFLDDTNATTGANLWLNVLGFSAIVPLYLAVGIAILRYRLYDIDVIIRKTVQYAVLTGLLALVYFGMILLLQSVFDSVSGQQSPLVIVVSTLIIAALFAPLRQRVQDVIDRRFFRKKYDAQQVLAQFAQTARDETDMDELTTVLTRVIQETMQPEQVGIWLKK